MNCVGCFHPLSSQRTFFVVYNKAQPSQRGVVTVPPSKAGKQLSLIPEARVHHVVVNRAKSVCDAHIALLGVICNYAPNQGGVEKNDYIRTMKQIRLELNSIEVLKNREHWNLYFIIATGHPDNPEKTVILIKPENDFIAFRNKTDNFYSFIPEGENTEGMFLLERKLPADRSIEVLFTLMHSRASARKFGERINEVIEAIGSSGSIKEVIGFSRPELLVINKAIGVVGNILEEVNDRNLGLVSMSEEFEDVGIQDRKQKLSSGNAEISWTWVCREL